jgi:hypothetical protein
MTAIKHWIAGAALAAAVVVPLFTAAPAEAGWRGSWSWHAGWAWHGGWDWHPGWGWPGVYVGAPAVAVGAPIYLYAAPYHWVPPHYAPNGAWVTGHWAY